MYFFYNQERCCSVMEKCVPDNLNEEAEKIGEHNYITNLKNLSAETQQAYDYFFNVA
jgi:hypothetical protein